MNEVDWIEAETFDRWIRFNAPALREHVSITKEQKPWLRDTKGIIIVSNLYARTQGAPVIRQVTIYPTDNT